MGGVIADCECELTQIMFTLKTCSFVRYLLILLEGNKLYYSKEREELNLESKLIARTNCTERFLYNRNCIKGGGKEFLFFIFIAAGKIRGNLP